MQNFLAQVPGLQNRANFDIFEDLFLLFVFGMYRAVYHIVYSTFTLLTH